MSAGTRKPRTIPDLSKRFRAWAPGGPRTICKFCEADITAKPKRGINSRRQIHLEKCRVFKIYVDDYEDFEQKMFRYKARKEVNEMDGAATNSTSENEEEDNGLKPATTVLDSTRESEDSNTEEEEEEHKVARTNHIACVIEQYLQEGNFPKPNEIDPPDEDTDIFSDMTM